MRKYKGIDVGRVVFACLIPILHIGFQSSVGIDITRQYLSRLGVPFFYAVSGMFLTSSIEKYGYNDALKRYVKRVGRMLLIWLIVYAPYILRPNISSIQNLLFKTPAFLWYLTGLIVASVPFCLIRNRKVLYVCTFTLYLFGTVYGDTYRWLLGGVPWYENIFLTTRNGIFFGLPLMCIGELTWKREKESISMLAISSVLLTAEITFVGTHAAQGDDRSMYLTLPFFILYLLLVLRNWHPEIDTSDWGGISSAIYLMQFGFITVGNMVINRLNIQTAWANWAVFVFVLIIPTVFYMLIKKTRLAKILF